MRVFQTNNNRLLVALAAVATIDGRLGRFPRKRKAVRIFWPQHRNVDDRSTHLDLLLEIRRSWLSSQVSVSRISGYGCLTRKQQPTGLSLARIRLQFWRESAGHQNRRHEYRPYPLFSKCAALVTVESLQSTGCTVACARHG